MANRPSDAPPASHNLLANHRAPSAPAFTGTQVRAQQQPLWVDEFLEFSSAKRSSHRRVVSDSMTAFTPSEECSHAGFDGIDDEQLMAMFGGQQLQAEERSSNASTTPSSDRRSTGEQGAGRTGASEAAEVQSAPRQEPPVFAGAGSAVEPNLDPRRVRRILANRQSAQRSRIRKLQYISDLERTVASLQTEVSTLSPRVAYLDHQRFVLNVDNSALKQRIAALAQDKLFKDAHQVALKNEVERLRQVYDHQQHEKMQSCCTDIELLS
ncbi:basic leucine zipper 61 isoform X1 [Amborella trichopoda]|uniref:basic leucine zipper 61 isoform X1 n=1 Tax=Amborella trichopoda TaxID=13333 RepID=UPI0005D2F783|nr:basic leucine zipper 61 isoform X1 [Amborella trichopoda]|eukprot:XP_020527795.1 basic leucine zipper 61 isoform X1 [Amborella trichopoda]